MSMSRFRVSLLLSMSLQMCSALDYFHIEGQPTAVQVKTCKNMNVRAQVVIPVFGYNEATWELVRDGAGVVAKKKTGPYYGLTNFPIDVDFQVAPVAGDYYIKMIPWAGGNRMLGPVQVKTISIPTTSAPRINGDGSKTVTVCAVGPIRLDATGGCGEGTFVSVQLSDQQWNRHGPEAGRWLSGQDFAKYGDLSNFDVKRFAEDQWFGFVPGQRYRVKLAVGPNWVESTQLISISGPVNKFKINNSTGPVVPITGPYSINLDASGSNCIMGYFVSVQLSDANWNRHGPEAMAWLSNADIAKYGQPTKFDIKRFAEDRWFAFKKGQHYRVKFAIREPYTESTILIRLD